jgi:hypothetical protein
LGLILNQCCSLWHSKSFWNTIGTFETSTDVRYLAYVWSGAVQYVAGFGIGTYTFRVLYWVIGISLTGATPLWMAVPAAKQQGPIWCFGASLARLLPVIEIDKEFTKFFDDPKRERLIGWQSFIFPRWASWAFCSARF